MCMSPNQIIVRNHQTGTGVINNNNNNTNNQEQRPQLSHGGRMNCCMSLKSYYITASIVCHICLRICLLSRLDSCELCRSVRSQNVPHWLAMKRAGQTGPSIRLCNYLVPVSSTLRQRHTSNKCFFCVYHQAKQLHCCGTHWHKQFLFSALAFSIF